MKRRIGVFGGTFDPPHIGHLILADEALHDLNLERLLWLLTPTPPHKTEMKITPWEQRFEMLSACLEEETRFEITRVDIDRPTPHYAVDTMRLLAGEYPDADLVYIMGGDSLRDLPTWHEPQQFLAVCHSLGVMRRPGDTFQLDKLEAILPGLMEKLQFMDAPLLGISSREIRQRIQQRHPFRHYVPEKVFAYIEANHLYL